MNAVEQASIIYPILVNVAKNKATITYGEINKALGYKSNASGHVIRFGLDILVLYCLENNLPKISSLIVNKGSGVPTQGYAYGTGEDISKEHAACYAQKWDKEIDYSGVWERRKELREQFNLK